MWIPDLLLLNAQPGKGLFRALCTSDPSGGQTAGWIHRFEGETLLSLSTLCLLLLILQLDRLFNCVVLSQRLMGFSKFLSLEFS